MQKVNLEEKFGKFQDFWNPRIAGELNNQYVKLAKFDGEFVWHKHDHEDELFLVVTGKLLIRLRDQEIVLMPGELLIVPRGVEHQPVALETSSVRLFEPKSTLNTGETRNAFTRETLEQA